MANNNLTTRWQTSIALAALGVAILTVNTIVGAVALILTRGDLTKSAVASLAGSAACALWLVGMAVREMLKVRKLRRRAGLPADSRDR